GRVRAQRDDRVERPGRRRSEPGPGGGRQAGSQEPRTDAQEAGAAGDEGEDDDSDRGQARHGPGRQGPEGSGDGQDNGPTVTHVVTRSRSEASLASPMPGTSRS